MHRSHNQCSQPSLLPASFTRTGGINTSSPYSTFKYLSSSIHFSPNKTKPLNKLPLSNISHRSVIPIHSSSVSNLSLKQRQQQLKSHFLQVNTDQRALTAKVLNAREKNIEAVIENNDSFADRYSPSKHKFSHKLIGDVQLPRKFFNMIPQEKELDEFRNLKILPVTEGIALNPVEKPVDSLYVNHMNKLRDRRRRAMTAIKHYKQLKIDPMAIPKIMEYLPGVPYGLPRSREFMYACKEGNIEVVTEMLEKNKWLAHVFDNSGQTALHWAVKRKNLDIAKALLQAGAWVDGLDFAGRSALFIAVKAENLEFVNFLLSNKANIMSKTRAGTSIFDGLTNSAIKSIIDKKLRNL